MNSFLMDIGAMAGVNDNEYHKKHFDRFLSAKDYQSCYAVVFTFSEPPPVMTSGAVNPDFDFKGNRIQDLMDIDVVPNLMAMNSFYDGENGFIVFSWLDYCAESPQKLVKSLLSKPENELELYLVQYMFKNFENCFISPDWWEGVSVCDKESIINLMAESVSLESDPSGDGIKKIRLSIKFPRIENIKFVGWHPEK